MDPKETLSMKLVSPAHKPLASWVLQGRKSHLPACHACMQHKNCMLFGGTKLLQHTGDKNARFR
jgi:hypothetical protein